MRVSLALALGALIAIASSACTLPAGEPCCTDDLACNEGARCFESRCALLCDDDSQCDEGETCLDEGVCRAPVRGDDASSCSPAPEEA